MVSITRADKTQILVNGQWKELGRVADGISFKVQRPATDTPIFDESVEALDFDPFETKVLATPTQTLTFVATSADQATHRLLFGDIR